MTPVEAGKRSNTIRSFALVCVAVTSLFIMGMRVWDQLLLGETDWCSRALGAAKYATGRPAEAIQQCFDLQRMQIRSITTGSLIDAATIALCLLVLIVIVVAGGRLNLRGGKDGVDLQISDGSDSPEVVGAHKVADAAADKAQEIEHQVAQQGSVPAPAPAATQAAAKSGETEILE